MLKIQLICKIKKITGLQDPLHHSDAATKFFIDKSMVSKADISYVDDEITKILNSGSVDLLLQVI